MIRTRLAALALIAGLGLVSGCSSLSSRGNNSCGTSSSSGGFFGFLHNRNNNNTVTECCPTTECPDCDLGASYEGPVLEAAPPTVVPLVPSTAVPSTALPLTSPPPRLVPTPQSSQMPWTP